jgi:alkylation response protein AidB-like acyl-CoA dehydrogenase
VDFGLSDEQRLFRQTLRDFTDSEIIAVASEWERTGRYPAEIVARPRELGLFGLNVPEVAIGEGTNDIQRLVIARSLVSGAGRLGW